VVTSNPTSLVGFEVCGKPSAALAGTQDQGFPLVMLMTQVEFTMLSNY